jgi:hypothetical protein
VHKQPALVRRKSTEKNVFANKEKLCSSSLSIDHSARVQVKTGDPRFLFVKEGMTVIVQHLPEVGYRSIEVQWWMADVIHVDGGARDPRVPTMFQVADVDDGTVLWVNADLVTHIVPSV